jgi:murein DD-endopeptidase MepM/ murein hydrolase activator NlpD
VNPFRNYTITSPYGDRISPINKKKEKHTGIDLVIAHQADIHAFVEGKCLFAQLASLGTGVGGFGNTVLILDKNKYLHLYGHLDSVCVKENDMVAIGQVIGKQGNTGQSAGSHLHYEVRTRFSPSYGWRTDTDPTEYLTKYFNEDGTEKLTEVNCNEIINILAKAWRESKSGIEKDRIHELANILRKETNQKIK